MNVLLVTGHNMRVEVCCRNFKGLNMKFLVGGGDMVARWEIYQESNSIQESIFIRIHTRIIFKHFLNDGF